MIHSIFDFWPFDIDSGPAFLAFYFVLTVGGLILAVIVRSSIAQRIDREAIADDPQPVQAIPAGHGSPYRYEAAPPAPVRKRLTTGWVPRPDELWAIAYLKEGTRGVANTLLGVAMTAGWLAQHPTESGVLVVHTQAPPGEVTARRFFERLVSVAGSERKLTVEFARGNATLIAEEKKAELEAELQAAGLYRTKDAEHRIARVVWFVAMPVLLVGLIRAVRGVELDRPIAFLVIEMIVLLAVTAILAAVTTRDSTLKNEYLQWLEDSTVSLRADVASGRRRDPGDVGLALAVAGAGAVTAAFAVLAATLIPVPVAVASSGSSGSSCSSSSCGGGGGCGG